MRARCTSANLTLSRGIALIAGLLLLSSMMVLALAVATGMLLERRMAAAFQDGQLAMQRALLAEKWAADWLQSWPENPLDPACSENCGASPPFFASGQIPEDAEFQSQAWWQSNGRTPGIEPITGQVRVDYSLPDEGDSIWMIEEVHSQPIEGISVSPGAAEPMLSFYRIFGRGKGNLPGSVIVTEALVAKPWVDDYTPASLPAGPGPNEFCEQVSEAIPCGTMSWRRRR